jgi:NIMA-interacting peptidyl-prolyl cis-trans isomerase 1
MSSSNKLPEGWTQKESKSHPGRFYYINSYTHETTWDLPTEPARPPGNEPQKVQCFHILRKHSGSRRPASWRQPHITQSKQEAIEQITAIREELMTVFHTQGPEQMFQRFQDIAYTESDCGSHERGGDLGQFGRGEMQRAFEEVSFALRPGELSNLVDTDSGIHVIFRLR